MPARILWIMRSPVFVRNFEAVLRELARRGHSVHVAFEGEKSGQPEQLSLIADLASEHETITVGPTSAPRGPGAVAELRCLAR